MTRAAIRSALTVLGICLIGAEIAAAAEQPPASPFRFSGEVRGELTDNRDFVDQGRESDFDLFFTPRVTAGLHPGRSILEVHYAPSLRYRANPSDTENDAVLFHDFGLHLEHAPITQIKLRLRESLYYTADPRIEEGGAAVRANNSYLWNRVEAGVIYQFPTTPHMDLDAHVSDVIKRYDDDTVAEQYDEDVVEGGLQVLRQLRETIAAKAIGRVVDYGYREIADVATRDFTVLIAALGMDKNFTPKVRGGFALGWASANYKNDALGADDGPYGEITIRGELQPDKRVDVALSHSMRDSDAYPYPSQEFTELSTRGEWGALNAKVIVGLQGVYRLGNYDTEFASGGVNYAAGDDTTVVLAADVAVKVGNQGTVKFIQKFEDVSSDVRLPYTKNTSSLAYQVAF